MSEISTLLRRARRVSLESGEAVLIVYASPKSQISVWQNDNASAVGFMQFSAVVDKVAEKLREQTAERIKKEFMKSGKSIRGFLRLGKKNKESGKK